MSLKLFYNSLSGSLLYLANIVVAFIMAPVMIHALGNRDYGLWEIVMSVVGYMGLLDLGIGGALVRFVSVAAAKEDQQDLQHTISTAFALFVGLGIVAVSLFLLFSWFPSLIGGDEVSEISNLHIIFLIFAVDAIMLFPLQVFIATLMGLQRHYIINNVRIATCIIKACLIYFLINLFSGKGLVVLSVITIIFTFIELVTFSMVLIFDKNIPSIRFSSVKIYKTKELVFFSVKSALMLIASRLTNQSIPIIIGNVIGLSHVVFFSIPDRLVTYAKNFSVAIGFPLTPYFGNLIGRAENDKLAKSWLETALLLQAISCAMIIFIYFLGENFISIWIGNEYAVAGKYVLRILLFGMIADSLSSNAFRLLVARNMHGKCSIIWLISSIISIPLGIYGAYFWGVEGVAVTVTATTVVANLITLFLACSSLNISLAEYFMHTILKLIIPLGTLFLCLSVICKIIQPDSYVNIAINSSVAVVIYFIFIWFFTLEKIIKNNIKIFIFSKMRNFLFL